MKKGDDHALKNKLHPHLGRASAEYRYQHFPLLNSEHDHWTLGVFDIETPIWQFYNSLRPRSRSQNDVYVNDVIIMEII